MATAISPNWEERPQEKSRPMRQTQIPRRDSCMDLW